MQPWGRGGSSAQDSRKSLFFQSFRIPHFFIFFALLCGIAQRLCDFAAVADTTTRSAGRVNS
jgi:hypothetical protein